MELKITTRQWADEKGILRTYHYYLTIDYISTGSFCCESYGVRISEDGGETSSVPSVTVSAVRMDELINMLVENHVAPSALADIVNDWL